MNTDQSVLDIDLSGEHIQVDAPPIEAAEHIVAENLARVSQILHRHLERVLAEGSNCHTVRVRTSISREKVYPVGGRFLQVAHHYELRSFSSWVLSPSEASKAATFWLKPCLVRGTIDTKLSWWPPEKRKDTELLCHVCWTTWTHFLNIDQLI